MERGEAAKVPESAGGRSRAVPLLLLLLLLAGGGAAAWRLRPLPPPVEPEEPRVGHTLELGDFVLNLQGHRLLKVGVALGVAEGYRAEELESQLPALRDAVVMTLSNRDGAELASREGKVRAKQALREAANRILGEQEAPVLEVYFTEFAAR